MNNKKKRFLKWLKYILENKEEYPETYELLYVKVPELLDNYPFWYPNAREEREKNPEWIECKKQAFELFEEWEKASGKHLVYDQEMSKMKIVCDQCGNIIKDTGRSYEDCSEVLTATELKDRLESGIFRPGDVVFHDTLNCTKCGFSVSYKTTPLA